MNQSDDDQTAANPMLYGPLHGAKISKTNQYIATVIRKLLELMELFGFLCAMKIITNIFSAVCLSAVSAGTALAWTSPVLPQLDDRNGTLISANGTLYMSSEQREF